MSYASLANYSSQLNAEYQQDELSPEDSAWAGSPFNWIRERPSGTKGSIGRDLAFSIFENLSTQVVRSGMAIEVNGKRVRVKFSMAWNEGAFRFQQLRDEPFEYVFCLGLYPESAYGWFIPKSELIVDGVWQEREGFTGQHGGAISTDTHWFEVNPANVPEWLASYGGTLGAVENLIRLTI